jgi:hypothetical protein
MIHSSGAATRLTRRFAGATFEAALIAVLLAIVAIALAPAYGPARFAISSGTADAAPLRISIGLADAEVGAASSGTVTIRVTRSAPFGDVLWVSNECFDAAGASLGRRDAAVLWGLWSSLEGSAGPFEASGARCTAIATWKPWLGHAIKGTQLSDAGAG